MTDAHAPEVQIFLKELDVSRANLDDIPWMDLFRPMRFQPAAVHHRSISAAQILQRNFIGGAMEPRVTDSC